MSEKEPIRDRFCRNCGAETREGTNFCVSCGVRIDQEPETSVGEESVRAKREPASAIRIASSPIAVFQRLRTLEAFRTTLFALLGTSAVYMLVTYTGLFLTFVFILSLACILVRVGVKYENYQRLIETVRQHQLLVGTGLFILICSVSITMPIFGAVVLTVLQVITGIVLTVVAAAGVIGIVWLIVQAVMKAAAEHQAREEAHRRWYASLSEQEKQTYQMERQTRLMEEKRRREQFERIQRQMNKQRYR